MSDPSFDTRLERLFAQAPRVADPDGFTARVQARLDREWTLRRGLIGAAGLVGGVIAATQTVGAEMFSRFGETLAPVRRSLTDGLARSWSAELPTEGLMSGDALWAMAALAAMAATLAVARAADAF